MKRKLITAFLGSAMLLSTAAHAQDSGDVLVMRRHLSPPQVLAGPQDPSPEAPPAIKAKILNGDFSSGSDHWILEGDTHVIQVNTPDGYDMMAGLNYASSISQKIETANKRYTLTFILRMYKSANSSSTVSVAWNNDVYQFSATYDGWITYNYSIPVTGSGSVDTLKFTSHGSHGLARVGRIVISE